MRSIPPNLATNLAKRRVRWRSAPPIVLRKLKTPLLERCFLVIYPIFLIIFARRDFLRDAVFFLISLVFAALSIAL